MAVGHRRDHWRHQPRVPRGVGEEGGQWTDDPAWAAGLAGKMSQPSREYKQIWWDEVQVGGESVEDDGESPVPVGGYTDSERAALEAWVDEGPINGELAAAMRGGEDLDREAVAQDYLDEPPYEPFDKIRINLGEMADQLRSLIGRSELTDDAELWRGLALTREEADELFAPGTVVQDDAFASTAMAREHAEGMLGLRLAEDWSKEPWLLKIHAPAGTNAAPGAAAVSELILSDKQRMRVISAAPPDEDEYAPGIIEVELL